MAAGAPVCSEKMKMPSGRVDPRKACRKSEADQSALHIDQVEHDLIARQYLAQRLVGRGLRLDAARLQLREAPVDPHRLNEPEIADPRIEQCAERCQIQTGRHGDFWVRLKARHRGERDSNGVGRESRTTARRYLPDLLAEDDHLAVQGVEGAEPKIAMRLELARGQLAVIAASRQRRDR